MKRDRVPRQVDHLTDLFDQSADPLVARFPQTPDTIEKVEQVRSVLAWAIPMIRIHRAHDAARLGELIRSSAYRPRETGGRSTWRLEG